MLPISIPQMEGSQYVIHPTSLMSDHLDVIIDVIIDELPKDIAHGYPLIPHREEVIFHLYSVKAAASSAKCRARRGS